MNTDLQQKFQKQINQLNQKEVDIEDSFIYGVNEVLKPGLLGQIDNALIESQNVSLKDKAFFYHLFSILINAGINTLQALKILANKSENRKLKRVLNTIIYDVEKGESLSRSFEKFPTIFGQSEIGVLSAGESTGSLDVTLTKLAEQTEEQNELVTQLKSALTYPIIVFGILSLAIFLMFGFVIPKLVALFVDNGLALPLVTKVMLSISNIIKDFWFLIIAGILVIGILLSSYFQTKNGKFQFDLLKLKSPIAGEILKKVYLVNFFSTLALLVDAGVPLQESIKITTQVVNNEVYKLKIEDLRNAVQIGDKLSSNLAETPFLFPETVTRMLEIGETSATLAEMSSKISSQYLGEVRYALKNLSSVIGPIVIVLVGAFVAVFALAILGPVFQLSEGLI